MNELKSINYLFKDNFSRSIMYQLDIVNFKETKIKVFGSEKNIKEDILDEESAKTKANLMMDIIDTWNGKYINNKILDGFEFKILVEYENNEAKLIYGRNKFPSDFSVFKSLLGEI